MPDIFVPLDTVLLNDAYLHMRQSVPQFVYRLIEKEPLPAESTLSSFLKNYQVTDKVVQELVDFAREHGEHFEAPLTPAINKEVKRLIKARVARHYFKEEGFYSVWNQEDEMIEIARKQLKKPQPIVAETVE